MEHKCPTCGQPMDFYLAYLSAGWVCNKCGYPKVTVTDHADYTDSQKVSNKLEP